MMDINRNQTFWCMGEDMVLKGSVIKSDDGMECNVSDVPFDEAKGLINSKEGIIEELFQVDTEMVESGIERVTLPGGISTMKVVDMGMPVIISGGKSMKCDVDGETSDVSCSL